MRSTPRSPIATGSLLAAFLAPFLTGCKSTHERYGRSQVEAALGERTGHRIRSEVKPGQDPIPPGVSLEDGLSEDEAVAVALWNNPAFEETLSEIGLSRADLIEAGLLPNPVFSIFFPIGPKQLEFTLKFPLEVLFFRGKRVALAEKNAERVAEGLVQNGLDLVRQVKLEYAGLVLAGELERLSREALGLRTRIAELAQARVRAGDSSELEAAAARIDALRAGEEARRLQHEVTLAEARLRAVLGLGLESGSLSLEPSPLVPPPERSAADLLEEALAARPDLRAAELRMEAAGKRAGLERWEFLALTVMLDANQDSREGTDLGPGLEFPIPLFNRNQGGIARAEAEIERAARRYAAVRERIALEVREAHTRLVQAREDLEIWRTRILPPLEEAVRQAESAYQGGDVSLLLVLETTRQLFDARRSEAEAAAGLRRALSELERSVGRRLSPGELP